jgi:micrococcal nuclease
LVAAKSRFDPRPKALPFAGRIAYYGIVILVQSIFSQRPPSGLVIVAGTALALGMAVGALLGPQLAVSAGSAGPASAATPETIPAAPDDAGPFRLSHPAQVVRVLDGDTFEARVSVWPGLEISTKVRLRGIDAPEMRARCSEESARAQAARDTLSAILAEGAVGISQVTLDKYGGRVLAAASTRKTADVSAALLHTGVVRSYQGGRREGWC